MAANLTTFYTRVGGLFDMAEAIRTHQVNIDAKMTNVVSNYSDADMHYLDSLVNNLQHHIDAAGRIFSDIQKAAVKTLVETFDNDPEAGTALESKTVAGALDELRRQMITQSKTISRATQAIAATSAVDGTGNGTMILTSLAPLKETGSAVTPHFQSVKQEQIRATCVADAGSSRIDSTLEEFIVRGQRAESRSSHLWPKGSGINSRVAVTSPNIHGAKGPGKNICTNSNFENWTSNVPDNWTLTSGTAGTHIVPTTAYEANGTTGLEFDNDGSTVCTIKQTLNDASGTLGSPDRPYLISFSIRELGTVSAGTVTVSLKNSGGTILHNGDALRECSLGVTHSSITTAHVRHSKVVWTPLVIGKGAYIELSTSVALTNNSEVFVDSLVIAEMHRPMPGGVAFAIVPGTTDFVLNDQMTSAVTNNYAGELARELNRFYDTESRGIAIPDSGSPNIADSLIE